MYICVCRGITDRQIQEAVLQGASSVCDIQNKLGAAMDCGSCVECIHEIVTEYLIPASKICTIPNPPTIVFSHTGVFHDPK